MNTIREHALYLREGTARGAEALLVAVPPRRRFAAAELLSGERARATAVRTESPFICLPHRSYCKGNWQLQALGLQEGDEVTEGGVRAACSR